MRRSNLKLCVKEGKLCFPREQMVRNALREAIRDGRNERRYYRCKWCHDWHLTSQPARKSPNRRNSSGTDLGVNRPGGFRLVVTRDSDGIPRIQKEDSEGMGNPQK